MTTTKLPAHGGMPLPSTREVTNRTAGIQVISNVADTLLNTCPAIPAMNNPVKIEATVQLVGTNGVGSADETVIFKLFRNGVEIDATDEYAETMKNGAFVFTTTTCHWMDETPGNSPVYTLLARSTGTNVEATNRRLTATT